MDFTWFQHGPVPTNAISGYYDYSLVSLSYLIAVLVSYVALDLVGRLREEPSEYIKIYWLIGGAFCMGVGIWTMHFIGMLAFIMPMPVSYSVAWTSSSLFAAMLASGLALFLLRKKGIPAIYMISGGVILGFAIATMHYMGMTGMQGCGKITYLPGLFFLSIVIAIVASEAALWLALKSREGSYQRQFYFKMVSALVMGLAICGMHYTGMAAAVFSPDHMSALAKEAIVVAPYSLALPIAGLTGFIICIALMASNYRQLTLNVQRAQEEAKYLAEITEAHNLLEQRVEERTHQLKQTNEELHQSQKVLEKLNEQLIREIAEHEKADAKAVHLNGQLVLAARRAGMADIATSVLHNIGNVLNSVNTSVAMVTEKVIQTKITNFPKLVNLLEEHKDNLGDFFDNDVKGQQALKYFPMLSEAWVQDQKYLIEELAALDKNTQHIRNIIAKQQSLSVSIGLTEEIKIDNLLDDALALNKTVYERANIEVIREFMPLRRVMIDRVMLLQILVNLIKNAVDSLLESKNEPKKIILKTETAAGNFFTLQIIDNGLGILPENIPKIFSHGFTTKRDGHGFGLHASIISAQEMGGDLNVESEGLEKGAIFTLTLPYRPIERTGT